MLWTTISRQRVNENKCYTEVLVIQIEKNTERRLQERTVDALASGGDEGRGKLRQAPGNCKQVLIRRYPNGATRHVEDMSPIYWSKRGELKHLSTPRKRKKLSIPLVVAIERGRAQTDVVTASSGL